MLLNCPLNHIVGKNRVFNRKVKDWGEVFESAKSDVMFWVSIDIKFSIRTPSVINTN